jgi:hypothetical protein
VDPPLPTVAAPDGGYEGNSAIANNLTHSGREMSKEAETETAGEEKESIQQKAERLKRTIKAGYAIAQLLRKFNYAELLEEFDTADTIMPLFDPTAYMRNQKDRERNRDLIRALARAKNEIARVCGKELDILDVFGDPLVELARNVAEDAGA